MDCYRLENALGVFLPNGKAAGDSGGLCQLSTVSCQRPIDAKCRAFAFEWICPLGGRDGLRFSIRPLQGRKQAPDALAALAVAYAVAGNQPQGWWWVSSPLGRMLADQAGLRPNPETAGSTHPFHTLSFKLSSMH